MKLAKHLIILVCPDKSGWLVSLYDYVKIVMWVFVIHNNLLYCLPLLS
jgi:hypothetical protein